MECSWDPNQSEGLPNVSSSSVHECWYTLNTQLHGPPTIFHPGAPSRHPRGLPICPFPLSLEQKMGSESVETADRHLLAVKMFNMVSCVMLWYDIALTFGDEVEKIWKQRFTGATILWFMNRYPLPLGVEHMLIPDSPAIHDPSWTGAACSRYVLFPEGLKLVTTTAVSGMAAHIHSAVWAFTNGTALQLQPGIVGCVLAPKSAPGKRFVYTWIVELVFDSIVFFATLYRTLSFYRATRIIRTQSLIRLIMRDGIMYFAIIFASNLLTVLLFILAPDDLKPINTPFSTVTKHDFVSSIIGNLGEPLSPWADDEDHRTSPGVTAPIVEDDGEMIELRL
ncbi:hypothetical protein OBBRIDRAFT_807230 [Obba rivulosa]|uniref:DUF6533 domain-containing protein n=1 Tax=Obba rivulosa TaxID=1052685 RepID=A0A8E2DGC9_9APHY|nr:hypothetical protein OBBRIDRAFT_807230 [Obba rivulosa]